MKKIVTFLLLSAFFLNIIGYHFIFQLQQHKIREGMEKYLRSPANIQNAIELRFSLSDKSSLSKLKWEDEKEFVFNGEMYDVIEKKSNTDELIILCVKDKKESHLVNDYAKINKETQGDQSKNKSATLLKLITGIFIKDELPVITVPGFESKKYSNLLNDAICRGINEIIIPPPQAC